MSKFVNYQQYLGAQRCCDLRGVGPPGPQGNKGDQGDIGPRGFTGTTGTTGATGARGCRGYTGPAGGPEGPTGPTGPAAPVTVLRGFQGDPGFTGPTGPQGPIGPTGTIVNEIIQRNIFSDTLVDAKSVSLSPPSAWGVSDYTTNFFTIPSGEVWVFEWNAIFYQYNQASNTRPEHVFTYESRFTPSDIIETVNVATGPHGGILSAQGLIILNSIISPGQRNISWGTAVSGGSQRFTWEAARLVIKLHKVTQQLTGII
jgi:hypothetical protein